MLFRVFLKVFPRCPGGHVSSPSQISRASAPGRLDQKRLLHLAINLGEIGPRGQQEIFRELVWRTLRSRCPLGPTLGRMRFGGGGTAEDSRWSAAAGGSGVVMVGGKTFSCSMWGES